MSSVLKKHSISFRNGKMIKLGNLDFLMTGRKAYRITFSQTSDGDPVVNLCLVNLVVEPQFYHQIKYQDSNFHLGPLFSFFFSFFFFKEEGVTCTVQFL